MTDCTDLLQPAIEDVLGEFRIEPDESGCLVVTPFQHHNGDLVRLWIEPKRSDQQLIRDYGETFAMLELYGVNPKSDANKPRLREIRDQFNLTSGFEGELAAMVTTEPLGNRLLDVIQAAQAASYLMYTHQARQPSQFRTTVADYIQTVGYDYETNVSISGETEERRFDIGINHRSPQVLLDTIHSKRSWDLRNQVDRVKLNWYEIKSSSHSHGAVIDDVGGIYDDEIIAKIDELDYLFRWSEKEAISQQIPVKS